MPEEKLRRFILVNYATGELREPVAKSIRTALQSLGWDYEQCGLLGVKENEKELQEIKDER